MDSFTFCHDEFDLPVHLDIYKFNEKGKHKKITTGAIKYGQFVESSGSFEVELDNNAGSLHFEKVDVRNKISFLDYIMGGCEIGVHIAIDFTFSNSPPKDPKSLHYLNPSTMRNMYTDAIYEVVGILQNYDADQMFPVYGFGAKITGNPNKSHCFALNGNIF